MDYVIRRIYNFVTEYAEEVTDGQQSCRSYVCFAENRITTEVSIILTRRMPRYFY